MNITREKNAVFFNSSLLALVTSTGLFVMQDVRSRIKHIDDVTEFDKLLLAEGQVGLHYVDKLSDFTDPHKAFKRFLETGEKSPFYDFQNADIVARQQFVELRDRFKAGFNVPGLPQPEGLEHFLVLFDGDAEKAQAALEWANGRVNQLAGPDIIRRTNSPNILRFHKTGGTEAKPIGRIITQHGSTVKKSAAEDIFKAAMRHWDSNPTGTGGLMSVEARERWNSSWANSHRVGITPDAITIGCQTIPRSEVERIGGLMGWSV